MFSDSPSSQCKTVPSVGLVVCFPPSLPHVAVVGECGGFILLLYRDVRGHNQPTCHIAEKKFGVRSLCISGKFVTQLLN